MSQIIKRIGPTVAVLGLVVWCCWPYLSKSAASFGGSHESQLPRIARTLLDPVIPKPTGRDPFRAKADVEAENKKLAEEAARRRAEAAKQQAIVPLNAMKSFFHKLNEDRKWLAQRQAARTAVAAPPVVVPPTPDELSRRLQLNATYIRAGERLAVINKRIYAEGDDVALPKSRGATQPESDETSCTIQHVLPDRVILVIRGETVSLTYPTTLTSVKRNDPAGTPAVPAIDAATLENATHLLQSLPVPPTADGA